AFGEGALRGDEAGRTSDDVRRIGGGDDRLDQVSRDDAIGVDEDQEVPPGRAGAPVPSISRTVALALEDDGALRPGRSLRSVAAPGVRNEDLHRRPGLGPQGFEQRGKALRL